MRRRTPGVKKAGELLAERIAHAEREEPERVIRLLEPLVLERRRQRLLDVIGQRLASVSVVFDSPYDPHNGAAVVRSCDAFGVQVLHIVERHDVSFLAAGSVARGTEKWIDIVCHRSTETVLEAARAADLELVAADPSGALLPGELRAVARLAIVVGNERNGIADDLRAACRRHVRVPMRGFVESLNVSVTAAILLQAATAGRAGDLDQATQRRLYARGLYYSVEHADEMLSYGGR